ncbi:MAG TPA: hypothetical protein VFW94_06980 [Candidatus Acidoferrales bacterium]|nr:hypothetical protein [Candidatus Acidoferrales bacterium]
MSTLPSTRDASSVSPPQVEASTRPTPATLKRAVEELRPVWMSLDHGQRAKAILRLWDICDREGVDPELALELLDNLNQCD